MIILLLITKEYCPKCEYVKNLFNDITLDTMYILITINATINPKIFEQFLEKGKTYNAPILVILKSDEKKLIMDKGMTKENITKTINNFIRKT